MRLSERFLLPALLFALVTILLLINSTWRVDQLFYDWKIQASKPPAEPDILIVAIDEQSLNEIGRWPWPRSVHADLVAKLDAAGAKVIGFDILFSEPDTEHPGSDGLLVDAIAKSGRVVLPVATEQPRLGGQLVEALPLPELARAAAALGHVDRQLDPDSIVRSTYLKAGLGTPHWPSFALAMLEIANPTAHRELAGLRQPSTTTESPLVWYRDYQIWIPYAGAPGTIPRVSYVDVINDRIPKEHYKDAFVIVGATAIGMGDLLPTPVSGQSRPMPGVEIVANELNALRQGTEILPLSPIWTWIISVFLVLTPTMLYPGTPRWSLGLWGGFIALNILFSMVLLGSSGLWFAPASAMIVQFLSYPMWSWRRLVQTVIYLNRALQSLHAERMVPSPSPEMSLDTAMTFLQHVAPLSGAVIVNPESGTREQWGEAPTRSDFSTLNPDQWDAGEPEAWIRITTGTGERYFGVRLKNRDVPRQKTLDVLKPIIASLREPSHSNSPRSVVEYIQRRIQQVQIATDKIQSMRRFVTDTLAGMARGIVVTDATGNIILANPQAEKYLGLGFGDSIVGHPVVDSLFGLKTIEGHNWPNALYLALIEGESVELAARTANGLHLLVQISPFSYDTEKSRGLLLDFADVSVLRGSERQRRELVTFISHDLRSPLSSILAITGVAKIDPQRMDASAIERIEENAFKTLSLADDFLEFNRAEAIERSDFRLVNLSALAHQAIDSIVDQALAKNISLSRELPDEANILGDARLLERTFVNLLENAIKYCPHDGAVKMDIQKDSNLVRCVVTDTGYGISESNLDKIFNKFQRIENPDHDQKRGSGLGLSFVETVVELHLGEIEVESELEVGSSFTLSFPTHNE